MGTNCTQISIMTSENERLQRDIFLAPLNIGAPGYHVYSLNLFHSLLCFYPYLSCLTFRGAAVTPTVRTRCPLRGATEGFIPAAQEARTGSRRFLKREFSPGPILPCWCSKAQHTVKVLKMSDLHQIYFALLSGRS